MNELLHCTPEQVGIPTRAVQAFLDRAEQKGIELHSFMLLRHGKVCAQGWWKPYGPEYVHPMYSFSKSLTSTAIGFAVQEGLLALEDRLVDIFPDKLPENPSENLKKATIRDLLVMGCGHETEPRGEKDWIRDFLAHPFVYEPGTMFQYNTEGTNMLCAALYRKSGQQLTAFLRERLFDKIGVGEVACFADPDDGTEIGGAGYRLRTEDMARFMQFVLQKGVWNGERLLNEEWFHQATGKQIETANDIYPGKEDWAVGYGFQFWRCKPAGVFRADGLWGQFGIAMTEQDALLIITEATGHTQDTLDIVWGTLLPAFQEEALPEDAAAQAALEYRLKNLTLAELPAGKLNPWDTAKRFEKAYGPAGKEPACFYLDMICSFLGGGDEPAALEKLSLIFEEDEATLCLTEKGEEREIAIGLAGDYAYSSYRGEPVASMGRFRSHYVFEVEIRCVQTAFGIRALFQFGEGTLTVSRCKTLLGYGDEPAVPDLALREVEEEDE